MIITQAVLAALRVMVDTRFQEVFEGTEAWSDKIATHVTQGAGAIGVYPFTGDQLTLREWIGPRMSQALTERVYSLPNKKYEGTLEIPREAIIDDSLGLYEAAIVPGFAEAMRKWPDQEIATRVFAANPTCFDGLEFWATNHPTFVGAGTYSNLHDISPYDVDGNFDYHLFGEALSTVRAAAMTVRGESGRVLGTNPTVLVGPPQQEFRMRTLANSTVLPTANAGFVDNPWKGMITDVIVIPELGIDDPLDIYLKDLSKPMKPILWQERSSPVLKSFLEQTNMERAVRENKFTWYVDGSDGGPYRAAPGVSLPFLSHKIRIAAPPT